MDILTWDGRTIILSTLGVGLLLGLGGAIHHLYLAKARIYLQEGSKSPREVPAHRGGESCPATAYLRKFNVLPRELSPLLQVALFLMDPGLFLTLLMPSFWCVAVFHRSFTERLRSEPLSPVGIGFMTLLVILTVWYLLREYLTILRLIREDRVGVARILAVDPVRVSRSRAWSIRFEVEDPLNDVKFTTQKLVHDDPGRYLDDDTEWVFYHRTKGDQNADGPYTGDELVSQPVVQAKKEAWFLDERAVSMTFHADGRVTLAEGFPFLAYALFRLVGVILVLTLPIGPLVCLVAYMSYDWTVQASWLINPPKSPRSGG